MTKITASTDFLPRSTLHSYPIGDELILFDELTKQLFRNNPTTH